MRSWYLAVPLIGGLLPACGDNDTGAPGLYTDLGDCPTGASPVVADLYCENTGIQTYTPTGEDVPTMTLWGDVTDEDGDLTSYTAAVYFDPVLDGVVDTTFGMLPIAEGSYHAEECEVPSLILAMAVYLRGGEPLYETPYEWGLQVTDASGDVSELVMVECTTPTESGTSR